MLYSLRQKIHRHETTFQKPVIWIIRFVEAITVLLPFFWAMEAAAIKELPSDFLEEYIEYIASLEPNSTQNVQASKSTFFDGSRDIARIKSQVKHQSSFMKKFSPRWYFGRMSLKPGSEIETKKIALSPEQLRAQEDVYFEKNTSPTFRSDPAILPTAAVLLSF